MSSHLLATALSHALLLTLLESQFEKRLNGELEGRGRNRKQFSTASVDRDRADFPEPFTASV